MRMKVQVYDRGGVQGVQGGGVGFENVKLKMKGVNHSALHC
jgi:hypothetical protein